ncbi:ABC transporter ATP-binding protein [Tritonibacter mobilis]|nr:ABC transporter ATP-binding protein [Tritonibacter mobilis]
MSLAPSITIKGSASIDGTALFAPVSLTLDAGRWTCLLGGSGVGKSTILRLVCGLPTGAEFHGTITTSDGGALPSRVAYMAQDDLLLPWATIRENVQLGARLRAEPTDHLDLDEILARVGLSDHATKHPAELSGGQRQRAALARTLVEDKPVVLLDEPFSALDAQTRALMQELAVEVLQDKTVLIVTHDPSEAARLGHQIAIMTPNKLMTCPPPATSVPRPVEALETLKCQAALMRLLRGQGA